MDLSALMNLVLMGLMGLFNVASICMFFYVLCVLLFLYHFFPHNEKLLLAVNLSDFG